MHIQLFALEPSGYIVLLLTSATSDSSLLGSSVLAVRRFSGGGSSRVELVAYVRLHYPLFVLQAAISPVHFSTLKE